MGTTSYTYIARETTPKSLHVLQTTSPIKSSQETKPQKTKSQETQPPKMCQTQRAKLFCFECGDPSPTIHLTKAPCANTHCSDATLPPGAVSWQAPIHEQGRYFVTVDRKCLPRRKSPAETRYPGIPDDVAVPEELVGSCGCYLGNIPLTAVELQIHIKGISFNYISTSVKVYKLKINISL